MGEQHAADRAEGVNRGVRGDAAAVVRVQVGPALVAGIDPASPQADLVVLRRRLLTRIETANDPRRERYLQLLSVINGWSAPESLAPVFDWFIRALRAQMPEVG